jgi:hypothetical protein
VYAKLIYVFQELPYGARIGLFFPSVVDRDSWFVVHVNSGEGGLLEENEAKGEMGEKERFYFFLRGRGTVE